MQLILLDNARKERYREDILSMLRAADRDFIPPLSARFSPSQTDFHSTPLEAGVHTYFEDMRRESMLGAFEGDTLLGFVTFVENLTNAHISADALPNLYICTLLVKPEARGRNLTRVMYSHLFDTLFPTHALFTRTWSTNAAHIRILESFGFTLSERIENDRAPGIDTVYFCKIRK